MSAVFDKSSYASRLAPMLQGFDGPLAFAVFLTVSLRRDRAAGEAAAASRT